MRGVGPQFQASIYLLVAGYLERKENTAQSEYGALLDFQSGETIVFADSGVASAAGPAAHHSSMCRLSISLKCASRETTARPCCCAMAAIQMSFSGIGRLFARKAVLIRP